MLTVILVIHILIAIALVTTVLLQKSEGPMGGGMAGFGNVNGMNQGRARANPLTRLTTMLGIAFFGTSIGLALLAPTRVERESILSVPDGAVPSINMPVEEAPGDTPAVPTVPTVPSVPSVPTDQ